jgi:hypothetical protein
MSIAAAKEMELSKALLDLRRQAAEKNPEWQATRDAVLRKNAVSRKDENVAKQFKVKDSDNRLYHGNRWVTPHDPALKLRIRSQNHDSKVARHFGQRHRGCLRSLSQIAGSLKKASGIEDA